MASFEDLERVKLRFIETCERLLTSGQIQDGDFEAILEILEDIDDYTEDELYQRLRQLTRGAIDRFPWDAQ